MDNDHENHEYVHIDCDQCYEDMWRDAARYRPHPSVSENERFYNEACVNPDTYRKE